MVAAGEWVANWSKAFLLASSIRKTHTVLNQLWQKVQLTKRLCFETKGFHDLQQISLPLFSYNLFPQQRHNFKSYLNHVIDSIYYV